MIRPAKKALVASKNNLKANFKKAKFNKIASDVDSSNVSSCSAGGIRLISCFNSINMILIAFYFVFFVTRFYH